MGRDFLWGWVSRSSLPLPALSCVPSRCDFHHLALTGDWVPGVKLGPFSLARTPLGAQAPPQMGEYFRGACLGPGGCDSSRPRESVWTGAEVLAAILSLSHYNGLLKSFVYLLAKSYSTWDLNSPTSSQTCTPAGGAQGCTCWTSRDAPVSFRLLILSIYDHYHT